MIRYRRIKDVEQLQNQSIIIKILMTYFQIISLLRTIDIKVPDILPEASFYFGNPATNTTMNINCFIPEYFVGMHYLHYSFFFSLLIPIFHFLVFYLYSKIIAAFSKEPMRTNDLKAGTIFLFMYFQPEFIYQALQLITCTTIDQKSYSQANISIECNLKIHYTILLAFIIFLFGFLIPYLMYWRLSSIQKDEKINTTQFQLKNSQYIFLCIQYQPKCYYWEFIRMGERLLLIMITSIVNFNQTLKIVLYILVSQGYNYFLKKTLPFKIKQFNQLEIISNNVISFSFMLACTVYSGDLNYSLQVAFYLIFIMINWSFMFYAFILLAQEIFNILTNKMIDVIDQRRAIRKIFTCLMNCFHKISFFKVNFDLKIYLTKKRKPILYDKLRQILLQFLKLSNEERGIFFLSLKEQKNQSKYIQQLILQYKQRQLMKILSTEPSQQNFLENQKIRTSFPSKESCEFSQDIATKHSLYRHNKIIQNQLSLMNPQETLSNKISCLPITESCNFSEILVTNLNLNTNTDTLEKETGQAIIL